MTIRSRSAELPGVDIEVEGVREYPTGSLTAAVIGFLGPVPAGQQDYYREKGFVAGRDKVGYAGIEATMQDILGGKNGERLIEVDVSGQELRNLVDPVEAIPGNNIQLTIDTRLQSVAQQALIGEIDFWNTYFNEDPIVQRGGGCHESEDRRDPGPGFLSDLRKQPHGALDPVILLPAVDHRSVETVVQPCDFGRTSPGVGV